MYSDNELCLFKSIPGFNIDILENPNVMPFMAYQSAIIIAFGNDLKGSNIDCLREISKYFLIDGNYRETPEFESIFEKIN